MYRRETWRILGCWVQFKSTKFLWALSNGKPGFWVQARSHTDLQGLLEFWLYFFVLCSSSGFTFYMQASLCSDTRWGPKTRAIISTTPTRLSRGNPASSFIHLSLQLSPPTYFITRCTTFWRDEWTSDVPFIDLLLSKCQLIYPSLCLSISTTVMWFPLFIDFLFYIDTCTQEESSTSADKTCFPIY